MNGRFVKKMDWNDPRFMPYNIKNLGKLNDAQLDALLDEDEADNNFPDFTEEELVELCGVSCRVELFHSNVCYGVEQNWPKELFNQPDMANLNTPQKKKLYHDMEKVAITLYDEYVDEDRLARRRLRRTNRAMAIPYELHYRKHVYKNLELLADTQPEKGPVDEENEAEEVDSDAEHYSLSEDLSQNTVIYTGTMRKTQDNYQNEENEENIDPNQNKPETSEKVAKQTRRKSTASKTDENSNIYNDDSDVSFVDIDSDDEEDPQRLAIDTGEDQYEIETNSMMSFTTETVAESDTESDTVSETPKNNRNWVCNASNISSSELRFPGTPEWDDIDDIQNIPGAIFEYAHPGAFDDID